MPWIGPEACAVGHRPLRRANGLAGTKLSFAEGEWKRARCQDQLRQLIGSQHAVARIRLGCQSQSKNALRGLPRGRQALKPGSNPARGGHFENERNDKFLSQLL